MNLRLMGAITVAFGMSMGSATPSAAQSVQLEQSGNTFHKAVCPHFTRPGVARCFAHVVTDSQGRIKTFPNGKPNFGFTGYTAQDLRSAYNLTSTGSKTIAIVDAYGYPTANADLQVYRSKYGLGECSTSNGCLTIVNQSGGTTLPATDTGWDQEQALDLDMVSAACPGCKIILVQANSANVTDLGEAVNTAARLGAYAISNSYGLTESSSLSTYEGAYNHPGIAVTVSTGDSGYGVQFPANSQYVTAVGGTSLTKTSTGRGWTETAWSGAGSGCSSYETKPTWQHDPLCTTRMVADVSAVADPNTGALVYGPTSSTAQGWMIIGGTSLSAPFIAGVYGDNGGAVNYGSNPYSAPAGSLNDVTSGNNGKRCQGTYFCTAGTGYDGPTGLGTPNGATAF
jgi:subtilase family serine protease